MFYYLSKLLGKVQDKPVQKIALGVLLVLILAVVAYQLVVWLRRRGTSGDSWLTLLGQASGAVVKVLIGLAAVAALAAHLSFQSIEFERQRGGVTQRNYDAVETIWGRPHVQNELNAKLVYYTEHYYNKDRMEIDPDKLAASTQPVGYRKEKKTHTVAGNPVIWADHLIDLSLNYRTKGGAKYPGFDTTCRFSYRLENFSGRKLEAVLDFPLPRRQGLVDDLASEVDGKPYRRPLEMSGDSVRWRIDMAPGVSRAVTVRYRSRGLAHLRFEPGSGRELSNYRVQMVCKGIGADELDYPIGCMTPTRVVADGSDTILTWEMKRAVTRLGMGLIVPEPQQAGYHVAKALAAAPWGLVLLLTLVIATILARGEAIRLVALVLLALAYHLYYLLMAHIGDYAPGLVGGMVIAGVALTSLVAFVQLGSYRGLCRWAPIGLFMIFCVAYPLLAISEQSGLLLTILYVVLLAYGVMLATLTRPAGKPGD